MIAALKSIALIIAISYLFYESVWAIFAFLPLGIYIFRMIIIREIEKRKQDFERQFLNALQSLQAQLNVGYSIENAMKEVQRELKMLYQKENHIIQEFTYMVHQLNLNITTEQVWRDFANRVQISEVDSFVTIFILAKRSGGDSIGIIRRAISQLNDKADVKKEIDTVITGKRLEFNVMTAIPFGMIFYMKFSFPEFMDSLYGNFRGIIFMSLCLGIYILAWRLGTRIVEIEV